MSGADQAREVTRGLSTLEADQRLGVSETTAKTHVGRILTKPALRDRMQIVVYAYENRIARPARTDPPGRP